MSSTGERVVAGRYRLRRMLGQGSMGTVWEAFDEYLHRTVSVKEVLLPPGIPDAEADELRERTLREARAIAALSHPNVITLHDVAREGGDPLVVTEYVLAHSLAHVVRALGPMDVPAAAAVGDAVAAGLAAAHQAGITHRDVKPGNVLVCVDGQVKLTDFGIARNVSEQTLTKTGIMLGSPAYIAPEVAAGREVTPAADLWGLGATLFAVVEGHPPYDSDRAPLETVNQVVHGEVPRPSVDGPMGEVIAALMVKDPAERIPLAEVRNRLHPLLPPPSTPLLSEQDLVLLDRAVEAEPAQAVGGDKAHEVREKSADEPAEEETGEEAPPPLAEEPGDLPSPALAPAPGALAATPGPLPFGVGARRGRVRRRRGAVATTLVVVVSVLLFCTAAAGGFALARFVGGQPVLPPRQAPVTTSTKIPPPQLGDLETQAGDAATLTGAQGGNYSVPVPHGWAKFVEQRKVEEGQETQASTLVYFVSPDGTQMLTVERLPGHYPANDIEDYLDTLEARQPNVTFELAYRKVIPGLAPGPEPAQELTYRTTTIAKDVVPDDPAAQNLNRVTFANAMPLGSDLWVLSVTVPVDQEDSGRTELFDKIAPKFLVTG